MFIKIDKIKIVIALCLIGFCAASQTEEDCNRDLNVNGYWKDSDGERVAIGRKPDQCEGFYQNPRMKYDLTFSEDKVTIHVGTRSFTGTIKNNGKTIDWGHSQETKEEAPPTTPEYTGSCGMGYEIKWKGTNRCMIYDPNYFHLSEFQGYCTDTSTCEWYKGWNDGTNSRHSLANCKQNCLEDSECEFVSYINNHNEKTCSRYKNCNDCQLTPYFGYETYWKVHNLRVGAGGDRNIEEYANDRNVEEKRGNENTQDDVQIRNLEIAQKKEDYQQGIRTKEIINKEFAQKKEDYEQSWDL